MLTALTACENSLETANDIRRECQDVNFTLCGDFTLTMQEETRADGLAADGKSMTDLWIVDYDTDGNLLQQLHQSSEEDGFGSPQMSLAFGNHVLKFVASRGKNPQLSVSDGIIGWSSPSDTFWASYQIGRAHV